MAGRCEDNLRELHFVCLPLVYEAIAKSCNKENVPSTLHYDVDAATCDQIKKMVALYKLLQKPPADIIETAIKHLKAAQVPFADDRSSPIRSLLVDELLNYYVYPAERVDNVETLVVNEPLEVVIDSFLSKIKFNWSPGVFFYPIDYDPANATYDRYNAVSSLHPPGACERWLNIPIVPVVATETELEYLVPNAYFDSMGQVLTFASVACDHYLLKLEYDGYRMYVLAMPYGYVVASFNLQKLLELYNDEQCRSKHWLSETTIILYGSDAIRRLKVPVRMSIHSKCGNMLFRRVMLENRR